jgi:predicted RNA-binding protein YlxR (DUF448 family)
MAVVIRTCVVCKERDTKENLLRFVGKKISNQLDGFNVELCVSGSMPGSGVYCHPTEYCFFDSRASYLIVSRLFRKNVNKNFQHNNLIQQATKDVIDKLNAKSELRLSKREQKIKSWIFDLMRKHKKVTSKAMIRL